MSSAELHLHRTTDEASENYKRECWTFSENQKYPNGQNLKEGVAPGSMTFDTKPEGSLRPPIHVHIHLHLKGWDTLKKKMESKRLESRTKVDVQKEFSYQVLETGRKTDDLVTVVKVT